MSMILRIEYDVASCKDCPLLGRDGVKYTCRLIASKHLDFLTFDQRRDEECPLVHDESRPEGKWRLLENGRYMCSECGSLENAVVWGNKKRYNFCWNCGAEMKNE